MFLKAGLWNPSQDVLIVRPRQRWAGNKDLPEIQRAGGTKSRNVFRGNKESGDSGPAGWAKIHFSPSWRWWCWALAVSVMKSQDKIFHFHSSLLSCGEDKWQAKCLCCYYFRWCLQGSCDESISNVIHPEECVSCPASPHSCQKGLKSASQEEELRGSSLMLRERRWTHNPLEKERERNIST